MKTRHRRLQRCTLPTSLPRSRLSWKIVQVGVHEQLCQKSRARGTEKRFLAPGSWNLNRSRGDGRPRPSGRAKLDNGMSRIKSELTSKIYVARGTFYLARPNNRLEKLIA